MTYLNPVISYGVERFCANCAATGIDGLIIPDLPPTELPLLDASAREHGIDTIYFVAPNSSPERIQKVAQSSSGFIYMVSITGVTGVRNTFSAGLDQVVATPLPFLVWRLTYNTGSHYLFGSVGQWVPYRMVMGIAAVAVVALVTMMAWDVHRASRSRLRTAQWWLVAVLIGALGNALEVLTRGRATDYFMLRPFPWPANLCDQYVNAAMFVLLPLTLWFGWRQGGSSTDPDPGSANA
jgi:lipoprotein signal peptidase